MALFLNSAPFPDVYNITLLVDLHVHGQRDNSMFPLKAWRTHSKCPFSFPLCSSFCRVTGRWQPRLKPKIAYYCFCFFGGTGTAHMRHEQAIFEKLFHVGYVVTIPETRVISIPELKPRFRPPHPPCKPLLMAGHKRCSSPDTLLLTIPLYS